MIKKKSTIQPSKEFLSLFKEEGFALNEKDLFIIEKNRAKLNALMKKVDKKVNKILKLSIKFYGHYLALTMSPLTEKQANRRLTEVANIINQLHKEIV